VIFNFQIIIIIILVAKIKKEKNRTSHDASRINDKYQVLNFDDFTN